MPPPEPPHTGGERVLGPPAGSFDADRVAAAARQRDPGLPAATAGLLAGQVWAQLRSLGGLDAPGLSRGLMTANPEAGASACNVVAAAAVAYCEAHGVTP